MTHSESTLLKKEIKFRASRRGMKELDLIFDKFLKTQLETLSHEQLERLQILLLETDQDLFSWLTGERKVPEEKQNDVYTLLSKMVTGRT